MTRSRHDRAADRAQRDNPPGFRARDQIDDLANLIAQVGGPRWGLAATYHCDLSFAEEWAEYVGLHGPTLILSHRITDPGVFGRRRTVFAVPGVGTHGKVLLVRGARGVVLQIGSANLTRDGLGGHARDIVWTVGVDKNQGPAEVVIAVCLWLVSLLDSSPYDIPDIDKWKVRIQQLKGMFRTESGDRPRLISNAKEPLIDQLDELMSGSICSCTVFSPYVHPVAVGRLSSESVVVVPREEERRRLQGSVDAWRHLRRNLRMLEQDDGVFTHAKIYLLRGNTRNWLAFGSANCTRAGLLCAAGQPLGGREVPAEVLMVQRLTKTQATALEANLRKGLVPAHVVDAHFIDEFDEEFEIDTLLAWATTDGTIHIAHSTSASRPPGYPELRRNGETIERFASKIPDVHGYLSVKSANKRWKQALRTAEAGWEITWATLQADIWYMADPEQADDVSTLWGSVRVREGAVTSGVPGTVLGKRSAVGDHVDRAHLDDFEQRSYRVARALDEDLRSDLPENGDLFHQLWQKHTDLGLREELPDKALSGARLFLAIRLLSVLDAYRDGLPPPYQRLRDEISGCLDALLAALEPRERTQFTRAGAGWRAAGMWTLEAKS